MVLHKISWRRLSAVKNIFGIKSFMLNSKNVEKSGYIWNMLGTTVMAFQSVIFLMILTRVAGLNAAGVFTIAYTTANLLLSVGKYGMHNYQVSDTKPLFNFGDYKWSRVITTVVMVAAGIFYALYCAFVQNQPSEKVWIILFMCIFKAEDSVEDVYCSLYQQLGRLDVAGKLMTVNVVIKMIFFSVCLLITKQLLISLIWTTLLGVALLIFLVMCCRGQFAVALKERADAKRVFTLLFKCAPLFLIGFLSYYITNAPKYSIDSLLTSERQACYGFIAMPVFVVGLMGNYLFNPIIRPLSEKWDEGDISWFTKKILKQSLMVMVITVVCVGGAFLLGIPVLSLLYDTNLSDYRSELLVLVASGGFLALSNQLMTVVTIIRRQNLSLIGYGACAVLALVLSPITVKRYDIMGAALMELAIMIVLCVIFIGILMVEIKRERKMKKIRRVIR